MNKIENISSIPITSEILSLIDLWVIKMIKTKIINVTRIIILNNGVRLDNASIYLKRNLVTRLF